MEEHSWRGFFMLEHKDFLGRFLREERFLRAYLLSATGDVHAADDILQTVASILWEKLAEYDESRPFGAWAVGVARLEVLKWRQRAARSREILSEQAIALLAETAVQNAEVLDQRCDFLAECLKELNAAACRVLQMKYAEGLAIRQIAESVGKSIPAVEMVLVRSRRDLRRCVERKMAPTARDA